MPIVVMPIVVMPIVVMPIVQRQENLPDIPEGEESDDVQMSIYSRFEFPSTEGLDIDAALAFVREKLGPDAALADIVDGEGGIAIRRAHDVAGRARLPKGTRAVPQAEWRGYVAFPPETPEGSVREVPIGEITAPASEIAALGCRIVVVIPLLWE